MAIVQQEAAAESMHSEGGRISQHISSGDSRVAAVSTGGPSVVLLTGGIDRPYAYGMSMALSSKGVSLDVLGFSELDCPAVRDAAKLSYCNFYNIQARHVSTARRITRHLSVYVRLIAYAAIAKSRIFHILWNNKFELFDRTLLMLYFKLLRKKIVLTAHNVNTAQRDGFDSTLNRLSLKIQYRLSDHIFVHTEKMMMDLTNEYGVQAGAVSVIPFGINNSVPNTGITSAEAKKSFGLDGSDKVILFFGRIRRYKGLDYLVSAFERLASADQSYRLIIAGEPKKESMLYWEGVRDRIQQSRIEGKIIREVKFIPDEDTELYFKAADLLVLPYTDVFQSGVLFLAYSFGLPVVATEVGSLSRDIVEGETGYFCRPCDDGDLCRTIEKYFASELFEKLEQRRAVIKALAESQNSWATVGEKISEVYSDLVSQRR